MNNLTRLDEALKAGGGMKIVAKPLCCPRCGAVIWTRVWPHKCREALREGERE